MSMSTHQEIAGALLAALTAEVKARVPRADALQEIEIQPVPMRTCYETMTRLHGPSVSVLDYAAYLFDEERKNRREPSPPLTIDEAQVNSENGEMTLVLTRGTFTGR